MNLNSNLKMVLLMYHTFEMKIYLHFKSVININLCINMFSPADDLILGEGLVPEV